MDRPVERVRSLPGDPLDVVTRALAAGVRPAAVAIVPPVSVAKPGSNSSRTAQVLRRSVFGGRSPGSKVARQAKATQATSSSIESRKCTITQPGARS